MARRRGTGRFGRVRRVGRGIGSSFKSGMLGNVFKGIGAGTVIGGIASLLFPQIAPIARPIAAYAAAGPAGAIGSILYDAATGQSSILGGLFGGFGGNGMMVAEEAV